MEKVAFKILKYFMEDYNSNGFNNLRFTIVDCLNNVDCLTTNEIDGLLF